MSGEEGRGMRLFSGGSVGSRIVRHDAIVKAHPNTASGVRVAGGLDHAPCPRPVVHAARRHGIPGIQR
jgi:hypothetical protein